MHNAYTHALAKLLQASHTLTRTLHLLDNGETSLTVVEKIIESKIAYQAYMKAFDEVPVRMIESNENWLKVIDSPVIVKRINDLHNGMELVEAYLVILNALGANFAVKPGDFLDLEIINRIYGRSTVDVIVKWNGDILKDIPHITRPNEGRTDSVHIHEAHVWKYLERILPKN